MKKIFAVAFIICLVSCGGVRNFQSFFNKYKNDVGVTAFQVPNFMRTLLGSISPEMGGVFNKIQDFKFITFSKISKQKQTELIQQMNTVTTNKYTDILHKNNVNATKILSVIEDGTVVKQAIIFNSTLAKTSVFYLKGSFDPNNLKKLSKTNQFENLSGKLLQHYQMPSNRGFNPEY